MKNIPLLVNCWKKPITVGRHAFGDQYRCTNFKVNEPGKVTTTFTPANGGKPQVFDVVSFPSDGGVCMTMYNYKSSIEGFAHSCMQMALMKNQPCYMTTKNTILKAYDGMFKDTFEEVYQKHYKEDFEKKKLWYEHR